MTAPRPPFWDILPLKTLTLPPATHTNAFLLGEDAFVVIDPGSSEPEEQQKLRTCIEARTNERGQVFRGVALTHHHMDHIAGLEAILEEYEVPLLAHAETLKRCKPYPHCEPLVEGQILALGAMELEVLFTPGHAPGHVCFWEPASRWLCAGDMVASKGTILVDPAEGSMSDYLASLERLRALSPATMVPSHGDAIEDPEKLLTHYIEHRLARERMTLKALGWTPASVEDLTPQIYPELNRKFYPLARRSVLAHLLKLEEEGKASRRGERWKLG